MGGELTCEDRTGDDIVTAAGKALNDFKNPFSTSNVAVRKTGASSTATGDKGYVNLVAAGNTITVTTCFDDSTDDDTANACSVDADRVSNSIEVAE
jgi:hypothetical protein